MKRLYFPHQLLFIIMLLLAWLPAWGQVKIGILSTKFVLEQKFRLMQQAAEEQGVLLDWTQVDREGNAGIERVVDGADLLLIDSPRNEDIAQVERMLNELPLDSALPRLHITIMNPPIRMRPVNLTDAVATRLFDYYINGTAVNHRRLFAYLEAYLTGGDTSAIPEPLALPNGGIYHPGYPEMIFSTLADYQNWWERHSGRKWQAPVIAMETSSSYLSDGQFRMLDETITAIERAGGVPLVFYRAPRASRMPPQTGQRAEQPSPQSTGNPGQSPPGPPPGRPDDLAAASTDGIFPNPKPIPPVSVDEPLIMQDGQVIANVLIVNTFLGLAPDMRKAWHQATGIPAINLLHYRTGNRQDYYRDLTGINSYFLPFWFTTAEYIGLQDPVILCTNEDGEMVPIPEQMDLLVGKAINLAKLQIKPNAEKKVALLFWNHPPGEKNQGASNLNVPRSIEYLNSQLRAAGYDFDPVGENEIISAVATMLRPRYRPGELESLMLSPHWDFLPLTHYQRWFAGLPESVRQEIDDYWGAPEQSTWIKEKNGVKGFVIPRMKAGNLVIMPQPARGEMTTDDDEKQLFHDTKVPLNHAYLAAYLWIREHFGADAILHFGTHGTQEWTPGKERGLWAYDSPNLLVGNTPVIYPYIVDNIGEAIHVKRRGRGVIVSHQTPAFAPAGLSDDFVAINEMIREYVMLDQGPVKEKNRGRIIEQAVKMNIHRDLSWKVADLERDFDRFLRDIENYLEDLGAAMQPLGLHTLGKDAELAHQINNVMQMLGQPFYDVLGVNPQEIFKGDYQQLQQTTPFQFVADKIFTDIPLSSIEDDQLRMQIMQGRQYREMLRASHEIDGVIKGLAARWIDPSYGGDPIRNPDALHTGRNMYGFDPSRIPTRAAYEAGKQALEGLVLEYQATHGGAFPEKLAFTVWSTETMRHLGMLEAQILYAMGVRPQWDAGGRVIGMEVIPQHELGRPRIDTVISITGLYRDQFPNVIERINEAIVMLANLDEPDAINLIRANTRHIKQQLIQEGADPDLAEEFALTRIFGNESGDYGTKLPDATLASDTWEENDGKLARLYLARMSWAYGPNQANWSKKLTGHDGQELNAYAQHLRGTSAAVFSRSSNLRGLLDTDHPFEYLGGISLAVQHLDGTAPQMYISNMRDPNRAKLETAEKFLAKELRAVYQHPNWMAEMQKEGYAGTLQMLNTINNFWGWQVMDRNVVRDDQWQEFHETYVMDRYQLGMREWFEQHNPTALAQITERMLEAIRKDYWQTDEQTVRELVQTYVDLANRFDVHTSNQTFEAYVQELAQGFGISPTPAGEANPVNPDEGSRPSIVQVEGQELQKVTETESDIDNLKWLFLLPVLLSFLAGMARQLIQRKPRLNPAV